MGTSQGWDDTSSITDSSSFEAMMIGRTLAINGYEYRTIRSKGMSGQR